MLKDILATIGVLSLFKNKDDLEKERKSRERIYYDEIDFGAGKGKDHDFFDL